MSRLLLRGDGLRGCEVEEGMGWRGCEGRDEGNGDEVEGEGREGRRGEGKGKKLGERMGKRLVG